MGFRGVTAEQMSEIDRRAQQEYGISQSLLMENAGKVMAEEIFKDLSMPSTLVSESPVTMAVLCGKGNNGGDGLVVARLVRERNIGVVVFAASCEAVKYGAASENMEAARRIGIEIRALDGFDPHGFTIAVDAMFGTGFKGALSGVYAEIGASLNASAVKIYAVDIPSGLDATTGAASPDTPRAFKTVTFGLPKAGFYLNDGPLVCGRIIVKDIGFPPELLREYSVS